MAQLFITAPTFFNSYITHNVNNMDLILILNQEKKY